MPTADEILAKYGLSSGSSAPKSSDVLAKYGLLSEEEKKQRDYEKTREGPFVGPPKELAGDETTQGEFWGGLGLDTLSGIQRAARGTVGSAVQAGLSLPSMAADGIASIFGMDTPGLAETALHDVNSAFQPGLDATESLKPEMYRREQSRPVFNDDWSFNGLSGEQVAGALASSLPQIPQLLVGGKGLSAATGSKALGYGLANAETVSQDQYFETYNEVLKQGREAGLDEAQARENAVAAAKQAEAGMASVGFLTGAAGLGTAARLGERSGSRLAAGFKGFGADAPFEAVEEAAQSVVSDVATGKDISGTRAAGGALLGAVTGGLPGAAVGAMTLPDTGVEGFDAGKDIAAEIQKVKPRFRATPEGTFEPVELPKPPKPRFRATPEGQFEPVAPTATTVAKPATELDPNAFAPDEEVASARARTAQLEADVQRQSQRDAVLSDLAGSKDRKVATAVRSLIDTGRIKFFGDGKVPEGGNSATDKGFFDGQTLYLNEAKLQKGEANSVALHEIKHFMDNVARQNGEQVRARSLRRILGDEGNTRVNTTIEALANSGNKIAQEAIEDARYGATTDGVLDQGVYGEEVGAYFLQRAQQAREAKKPLGRAGGVLRDMVSYAKAKLADFGIDLSLSENDILYLGRQLAPEAVRVAAQPVTKTAQKSMERPDTAGLEVEEMEFDPSLFPEQYINNNASGESEASLEAINRVRDEKELGRSRLLIDRDGTITPLTGVQAVDTFAGPGQVIVQRGVGDKEWTAISSDPRLSKELVESRINSTKPRFEGAVNFASKERPTAPNTPEFRNWFADSKVKDENGQPLVMYHGTSQSEDGQAFTSFDTYGSNYGLMGQGGYFTADPEVASSYTSKGRGDTPTVYPVYLSVKNPIDMDAPADAAAWKKQFPNAADYHEGGTSNESWYRAAEEALIDEQIPRYEGAEIMQDGLRSMGYDGITHIGGGRVKDSGKKHRVFIAFDPEQIKSSTGNSGAFNPESPSILAAKERPAQPKKSEKVQPTPQTTARAPAKDTGVSDITKDIGPTRLSKGVDKLKGKLPERVRQLWDATISPTQGKPADVTETTENARGKALLSTIESEQATNRLRDSVTKAAKGLPRAQRPQAQREVLKLVKDASAKDEATRTAARETLRQKHPGVYSEYMSVRNNIKRMGLDIRKSILESGRRLTNDDIRNIKAIEANLETYMTRSYRADIKGDIKADWEKKTQKAWEKETKGGKLTSEGAQVFEDAKNYLRNQLNIGTFDEVLEQAEDTDLESISRLQALHEAWVPREQATAVLPQGATPDQRAEYVEKAVEELKAKREQYIKQGTYDKTLEQKAVDLTKEILKKGQEGGSPMAQFFRGARLNRTVVMQRERIPPQIRKLWGEIEEPVAALATTMMRQGRYLADSKMLEEMYEFGKGKYFVDPAEATGTNFTERLTGDSLGPLNGMMATPQFKQAVESHVFQTASLEAFLTALSKGAVSPGVEAGAGLVANVLSKPAGMVKSFAVIWNPEQYVMNAVGSAATPILSGFLPGQGAARGIQAALGTVAPSSRKALNEYAKEVLGANLQESGQVGEIQAAQRDLLMKELIGSTTVQRKGQHAQSIATDVFAGTDNAGRFATYFAWKDWLKDYYKTKGETRTEEQIRREAAERTKRRSVTFSRVPALAKAAERTSLTMFLPYFVETYRVIGFSIADSFADVASGMKEGGKAGAMKRNIGLRGVMGGLGALAFNRAMIQTMTRAAGVGLIAMGLAPEGEEADEETLKRIQKGMAERFQGKELDLLEITPDGRYVFLEGNRMSMLDPSLSVANKLADGDVEGAWKDVKNLIFPNALLARLYANITQDKNPKPSVGNTMPETYEEMKSLLQEHTGMRPNTTNAVTNIAELFVPSVLKSSIAAAVGEQDFGPEVNLLAGIGAKLAVFDPKKALNGARFEYGDEVDKAGTMFKDVYSASEVSDQTLRVRYQEAINAEFEAFARLQNLIDASRATGMKDDEISALLGKEGAGLSKTQIRNALSNRFTPSIISENVFKASKAGELKGTKDKASVEAKYKRIQSVIKELDSQNKE
jgi:hypothetical protein